MAGLRDAVFTFGTTGNDDLTGDSRDDVLHGDAGNDNLTGNEGDDTLIGGAGADVLVGGAGADVLYGGAGADVMVYTFGDDADGTIDRFFGEGGDDQLILNLTSDQLTSDVADELNAFIADIEAGRDPGNGGAFAFQTFGLQASGIGGVQVFVDGLLREEALDTTPLAVDDTFTGVDDNRVADNVALNDTRPDDFTVTLVDGPAVGALTLLATGRFSYNPGNAFRSLSVGETATVTFTYELSGAFGTSRATATILLNGVNEDPTANDVAAEVDQNGTVAVDLLDASNASDIDAADTLAIGAIDGVMVDGTVGDVVVLTSGATVTIGADGTLIYAPNGQFDALPEGASGSDVAQVTIVDGQGGSVAIALNLTVLGVNDAPEAINDTATTDEETDVDITILGNDLDIDGDQLSVVAVGSFASGAAFAEAVLSSDAGPFEAAGIVLGANNGTGLDLSAGQTVSVAFLSATGRNGTAEGLPADDLIVHGLGNGSARISVSEDGETFTFLGVAIGGAPTAFDLADINFGGQVRVVQVEAQGTGGFTLDAVEIPEGIASRTIGGVTLQQDGQVTYDPVEQFDQLSVGDTATDSFGYVVEDAFGLRSLGVATVTINGVNDQPFGGAVNIQTDSATLVRDNIILASGAFDSDRNDVLVIEAINGQPVNGQTTLTLPSGTLLTIAPDGDFSYNPNGVFDPLTDGEQDADTATFTIGDGQGGSFTQTITFTIDGINDPPALVDDAFTTDQNTPITLDVLANDSDPDGILDRNQIIQLDDSGATGGQFSVDPQNGVLNFDPLADFVQLGVGETAETSAIYQVVDDLGAASTATVTVTVEGLNDGPSVGGIFEEISEDGPFTGNLLVDGGASDIDENDVLSVTEVNGTAVDANGTTVTLGSGVLLTVSQDGSFSYDTESGFDDLAEGDFGFDDFTYTVEDGNGGVAGGFASLTIRGVNDAPTADDIALTTDEDTNISGNLLTDSGASDPDNNAVLQLVAVQGQPIDPLSNGALFDLANGARLLVNADGSFTLTVTEFFDFLAEGDLITETFDFTIADEQGAEVTRSVSVDILGSNDNPFGDIAAPIVLEDELLTGNLIDDSGTIDLDDGDILTVSTVNGVDVGPAGTSVTTDQGGTLTVQQDGSYTYDQNGVFDGLSEGENAIDSAVFVVVDGNGGATELEFEPQINGVNDAPVANDFTITVGEDDETGGNILLESNAGDAEDGENVILLTVNGDNIDRAGTLTVTFADGGQLDTGVGGDYLFSTLGLYDFLAEGEILSEDFTITVADQDGLESEDVTGTLEILGVNDAPEVGSLIADVSDANINFTFDLLTDQTDPDNGAVLSVGNLQSVGDGFGASIVGNNFVLDASNVGGLAQGEELVVEYTYDVSDEFGATEENLFSLTVIGNSGAAPVATADTFLTDEDTIITDSVADNDDVQGGTFTLVTDVATGFLTLNADGSFEFDPGFEFDSLGEGDEDLVTFEYLLENANGSSQATAEITITGLNDRPGAVLGFVADVSLVTADISGLEGADGDAFAPQISGEGTSIAFSSEATDLVVDDLNDRADVFIAVGEDITLENDGNDIDNTVPDATGRDPNLSSRDGGFLVYATEADDLGPPDNNGVSDVYLKDRGNDVPSQLVSFSDGETTGNGASDNPSVSGDGRFVVFQSRATNLVEGITDANGEGRDVFLLNRETDEMLNISQIVEVQPGTEEAFDPVISADGSTVVFATRNVYDAADTNDLIDIYAYDVASGQFTLASVSDAELLGNGDAQSDLGNVAGISAPSISANGRYLTFVSQADNLVAGDDNGVADVFVRDLFFGTTERVSISLDLEEGDGTSYAADISGDGRFVTFQSDATNLDSLLADTNGVSDIFVHDRILRETIRVSVAPDFSAQPGGTQPSISDDGSVIAFISETSLAVYDPRVLTTDVSNVYTALLQNLGFAFSDQDGLQAVDLAQDIFDPEFAELSLEGVSIISDDSDRIVNFDLLGGGSVPGETEIQIDFEQFADLGNDAYEILTVDFDISDGFDTLPFQTVIVVQGINDAPVVNDALFEVGAGQLFSGTFNNAGIAFDPEFDELSFLVNGPPLDPLTLEENGDFTFLADVDQQGAVEVFIDVDDGNGGLATLSATFLINGPPIFEGLPGTQVAVVDQATSLDVGAAFSDPEGGNLTFSATLEDGTPLPGTLAIDAASGVISGTVASGDREFYRIAITATDDAGLSVVGETWLAVVDNAITGTPANDIINSTTDPALGNISTSQLIDAGAGNDSVDAGNNRDVYLFRFGEGFDTFQDAIGGFNDRVVVEGAVSTDVQYRRVGLDTDDVVVTLVGDDGFTNGFLWVDALSDSTVGQLTAIHFDDGVTVTRQDIIDDVLAGQAAGGDLFIQGTRTADQLVAVDGGFLSGGNDNDVYFYDGGIVTIDDVGNSASDELRINANVFDTAGGPFDTLPDTMVLGGSDDIVFTFSSADILTVRNGLSPRGPEAIETYVFNDATLSTAELRQLISNQQTGEGDDLIIALGNNAVDVLEGGLGDDTLSGGDAGDTYIYAAGDGDDVVDDRGNGDFDAIEITGFQLVIDFDGNIDFGDSDISFERVVGSPDDLLVVLDNGSDTGSILIIDTLNNTNTGQIESLLFPDQSASISMNQIREQLVFQQTSLGDDVITGFDVTEDLIVGALGNDVLDGGDGSDTYVYIAGDGDDTISDTGVFDTDILEVEGFDLIVDGNNVVQPGSQVTFAEVPGSNNDLLILLDNGIETGSILIDGGLASEFGFEIEELNFNGPTVSVQLTSADLFNQVVQQQITAGDDVVIGTFENDVIATGTGEDFASGGGGNDTYLYAAGDGRLVISDNSGSSGDRLEISGYDFADLEFTLLPGATPGTSGIRIAPIVGGGDEIVLPNAYNSVAGTRIEAFVDASGEERNSDDIVQQLVDDLVASGSERPLFASNRFTDVDSSIGIDLIFDGTEGSTSYTFAAGDGMDELIEARFGGTDTLLLDGFDSTDVGSSILFFTNPGEPSDIRIEFGSGDVLLLRQFDQLETITFGGDGQSFSIAQFAALVADPANTTIATEIDGDDFIDFTSTAANELLTGAGNGIGPSGSLENDIARFTIGAIGHDVITQGTFGSTDIIIDAGAGGEVRFDSSADNRGDLLISVFTAGNPNRAQYETITVVDWRGNFTTLENLTVTDIAGTRTLDLDDIGQIIVDQQASAGDDFIFGFGATNTADNGRGNEIIIGGQGDDVLRGGGGNATDVPGETRQDIYVFEIGIGGTGGSGRDFVTDNAFGDSDRIEFVSAGGSGSAALANATIRLDPNPNNFRDVVIDFGDDEITLDNLTGLGISDRYEEIVFDAGGAAEQTLSDEDVLALFVQGQITAGDDTIFGTDLADVLEGGTGNDLLRGFGSPGGDITDPGAVFDLYKFTVGGALAGGRDVIFDGTFGDLDVIEITSGVAGSATFDNATLRVDPSDGGDLIIDFGADELTIENLLSNDISARYQRITFDVGGAGEQSFTDLELVEAYINAQATAGDDSITGTSFDDVLAGGLGDDFLTGQGGNDTYVITSGEGIDRIRDVSGLSTDVVQIDVNFADVTLQRDSDAGNDLTITLPDGAVVIEELFSSGATNRIESFEFADTTLTFAEISALSVDAGLSDGTGVSRGTPNADVSITIDTDGDGTADTAAGNLVNGNGDEVLIGGGGGDEYLYRAFNGNNVIIDDQSGNTGDVLVLFGLTEDQVIFQAAPGDPNDLLITFEGFPGSVTIRDGLDTASFNNIETISINNGAIDNPVIVDLTLQEVRDLAHFNAVTAGDDRLFGISGDNDDIFTNVGRAGTAGGDDSFSGLGGDDGYTFANVDGLTQRMFIEENGRTTDTDILQVIGYLAEDVTVSRLSAGSADILLTLEGAPGEEDVIYLTDIAGGNAADELETFIFEGDVYTLAEIIGAADGTGMLPPGAPPPGGGGAPPGGGGAAPGGGGAAPGGGGSAPLFSPALISGDARANSMMMSNENEIIDAGAGSDTVRGFGGDDIISGGGGKDFLFGGSGNDTLDGGDGRDKVKGNSGNDDLSGGRGADVLVGGSGEDTLAGNGGADTLRGGGGADDLDGGNGTDKLKGGKGADIIEGGRGGDLLFGGGGRDIFVFADRFGKDTIRDFKDGRDMLDFVEHSSISTFADLLIFERNGDIIIEDGVGGRITLEGIDRGQIDIDDFIF